jgi:NADH-quinone oxidoreductase subunit E
MSEHLGGPHGSQVGLGTSEDIGDGSIGQELAQPAHFALDEESEREIEHILTKYPPARRASGVIPLLYVVQDQMRRTTGSAWVPRVAMDAVAQRLGIPPIRVYEVATFYLMFNTSPIGRYHLQVCTTTPCWLRGSDEVVRACRDETGIKEWDETSEDRVFTMTEVECLGACVNAPVLQVDNDYYEDLDYERTRTLLQALRRGERPAPGSTIGRQTSAPEGGPTTLVDAEAAGAGE